MSRLNITYKRANAKVQRNEELYNMYLELRDSGVSYDETMYELTKEFNLSRTRVGTILSDINKKLKKKLINSKK